MGFFCSFSFHLALETIKSIQGQSKNNFFNIALQGQQQKKTNKKNPDGKHLIRKLLSADELQSLCGGVVLTCNVPGLVMI